MTKPYCPNTFTCACCNQTFHKNEDWTDEEAQAEYRENFGSMPAATDVRVCDDCYKKLLATHRN